MKNETDKATARPWKWNIESTGDRWSIITDKRGNIVANVNSETGPDIPPLVSIKMPMEANAALIVRAVNEYDLLKALAEACSSYPDYALPSRINEALDALAAVRKGGGM